MDIRQYCSEGETYVKWQTVYDFHLDQCQMNNLYIFLKAVTLHLDSFIALFS